MRPIKSLLWLLGLCSVTTMNCQVTDASNALISYQRVNPDKIQDFKYVILESEVFNRFDVGLIKESNSLVLGYISLGEVSAKRSYFSQLKDKTLGRNELWDSYFLDLTDATTQKVLLAMVETIMKKGFDGLFIDTADVFGPWGSQSERSNEYVDFLRKVKEQFPDLHIMQNSGIPLLNKASEYINSVALESVITDYNFDNSSYEMRTSNGVNERVSSLRTASVDFKKPVLIIEYANTKRMQSRVQRRLQALGYDYFIGQIALEGFPKFK